MRQHRWVELLNNYDCEIRCHPRKANVVADALNRKIRLQLHSIRIQTDLSSRILSAHQSVITQGKMLDEMPKGTELQLQAKPNSLLCLSNRVWIPNQYNLRELLLNEAHKSH